MNKMQRNQPDWAERHSRTKTKPDWVDKIPHLLYELGDVFFPIPGRRKGWDYPHHLEDFRYLPDNKILNAYFEQGWGYGIACANDLAVVDVDEKEFVGKLAETLPETAHQWTGSREGTHFMYRVPGMNTRQILHYKDEEHDCDNDDHECAFNQDMECVKEYEWEHLGEIKCDPHGYVIGPGSVHPSGNTYGPLYGDRIAEVERDELLNILDDYIKPDYGHTVPDPSMVDYGLGSDDDGDYKSQYDFYNLECSDVVPWLEPGKRVPHPVHGSSTGKNFMRQEGEELFMCWRCDHGGSQGCALNPQQLLACMATGYDCDYVRRCWKGMPALHWEAWREAVDKGLVSYRDVPYKVARGYAISEEYIDSDDKLSGDLYWDTINAIKIEIEDDYLPDEPL